MQYKQLKILRGKEGFPMKKLTLSIFLVALTFAVPAFAQRDVEIPLVNGEYSLVVTPDHSAGKVAVDVFLKNPNQFTAKLLLKTYRVCIYDALEPVNCADTPINRGMSFTILPHSRLLMKHVDITNVIFSDGLEVKAELGISTMRGDVNGDGKAYEIDDVTYTASIYKRIETGQTSYLANIYDKVIRADLNRDGTVDLIDAMEAIHVWRDGWKSEADFDVELSDYLY